MLRLADFPNPRRDFKFRDQVVPAAASVSASIAEGYGRNAHGDFARFVGIAIGSLRETESWLRDGLDRGYWNANDTESAFRLCKRLTVSLGRLRGLPALNPHADLVTPAEPSPVHPHLST